MSNRAVSFHQYKSLSLFNDESIKWIAYHQLSNYSRNYFFLQNTALHEDISYSHLVAFSLKRTFTRR